jgi:very-short-patch-repair endonuclease
MPNEKLHRIKPTILRHAMDLRHPLTPAERKIWRAVRDNQLGFKIRRQHSIGRFIADFYCAEARLVIEIDGDTHAESNQFMYDLARTEWLEEQGYRVVRFDNEDVHENIEEVLEAIQTLCGKRIHFKFQQKNDGINRK